MKWKVFVNTHVGTPIEADELRIEYGVLIFLKEMTKSKLRIVTAFKDWRRITILEE